VVAMVDLRPMNWNFGRREPWPRTHRLAIQRSPEYVESMTTLLILHVASGVLFMALSLPLLWEKVPPNGLYGFRVRATLENHQIWYAANKFAAKRMLAAGAVFVVAALILYFIPGIDVDDYSIGCLVLFAVPFVIGLVQSLRHVKLLDRQTHYP
jgi:hypothetical protein